MNPSSRAVLADFAARLGGSILPDLKTPFLMNSAGLMTAILGMMAEGVDSAAANLVEENRAIRRLFGQGLELYPPPALAAGLEPLAAGSDDDLHLSSLEATNHALRAALIELHAWAEAEPRAGALNDAIWAELSKSTQRRKQSSAPF